MSDIKIHYIKDCDPFKFIFASLAQNQSLNSNDIIIIMYMNEKNNENCDSTVKKQKTVFS